MVVDERTLAIPDRPGNSILMGLQNVLANPNAGICFEIPGYGTTLRVGGKAELSNDPELLHLLEARGAKNALFAPFPYKVHDFAKTGSVQTRGKN